MDTGIGKDGYSIIGQGKIDEILSNKSEDRRNVFEEAAGIVKYKTRKQESEKKLEHTKLNLIRINDILTELENNIEPLKEQSEKARMFLNLKQDLKQIEVGLFVYNIEKYKKDLENVMQDIDIMNSNYNLEEEKLKQINELKENLKLNVEEIIEKTEKMQNIEFESQQKKEKLNSDINVFKAKIDNNMQNIERIEKENLELNEKIVSSENEIENKINKKNSLKQNKEKFEKELEQKQNELNELTKNFSEKEIKIEEKKKIVEDNNDKKYEIELNTNSQKANLINIENREKQIDSEISTSISEKDKARFEKEDIQKGFYEVENLKKDRENKLSEIGQIKKETENKIKNCDLKINNLTQELNFKNSRCNFLIETEKEKEGYVKSVKSLLKDCENIKELGKGMNGALEELIEVPEQYQTAIEMTLGIGLQNIVTENEQDAKKLIEYLRKNNLGRASFLPLTSIKGKKLEKFKNVDGVIGIASDLIKYDKKYEQIILNLLGRTVIVDNMNNAINLAKQNQYNFKIVTLDGDLINSSGSMTGGSVSKKTVNILGRNKEIEKLTKQIKKIKIDIEKLENEKKEILASNNEVFENQNKIENELQTIEIKYNVELQKQKSIEQNIEKIENIISNLKNEKEKLKNEKIEIENIIVRNNKQIEEFDIENEKYQKDIDEFTINNKENQKKVDDLNFDITNLKISVSSFDESENSITEITDIIKKEIENSKTSINNKINEIENLKKENEKLEKDIKDNFNKIEEIQNEVKNSGQSIEKLKNERIKINEKVNQIEKEQTDKYRIIEDLKSQIIKLEVKKNKFDEEINNQINKLWDEYELTPNATSDFEKPTNIQLTQKRANNLHEEIRNLGSVNMDSIEEYKNVKDRYDFMSEQRLDLENTIEKLQKMIVDITSTMKTQFKEKFEIINKNFGEVFVDLFGGGKAEIALEDENNVLECGININVQPPGKKLQNMLLLSGGERAFTAIALLFAILKMTPAPFCVLDEIEAALDDVNVYRYAEFLKKFAVDTQFLVITHRKGTMEAADTVYGVTMEEKGISKLLSMKLKN